LLRKKVLKNEAKIEIKADNKLEDWKTKKLAGIESVIDLQV